MDVNELIGTIEAKSKQAKAKDSSSKKGSDKSFDNVMDSISKNWEKKPISEIETLRAKLAKAEVEILNLKQGRSELTKNEEKILSAIRSEKLSQDSETPIISTSTLRKKYKVSAKYQGQSTKSLIDKGIVSRVEASYSGNVKTYRWKIIES
jgi:hypothetical protein